MPVVYGGMHSVMFIRLNDSTAKHSWSDLYLIPETRPTIALPEPKIQLIDIPGRSKRIDLTDYMPGGLTYGPRSGEFTFFVDHDRYGGWNAAYNELSALFNGEKFAVYLMDNVSYIYEGRVYLTDYNPGDSYSTVTLHYELEPDYVIDDYISATFVDSGSYGGGVLQKSMLKKNATPKFYGDLPQHPGYLFDYWTPTISPIATHTVYTAVYRAVEHYTIKFVDWDGAVLKSYVVNEGNKPVPPNIPVRIGYRFIDWDSEIVEANANKTYTAVYYKDDSFIEGVWEEVEKHLKDGSYKTYYHVGDRVFLDIDGEYNDYAEIVAIDKDVKSTESDDSRIMPLTFVTKGVLIDNKPYNDTRKNSLTHYSGSNLRTYVTELMNKMPTVLQDMLISVYKYDANESSTLACSFDKLWIPSGREVFGGTSYGRYGVTYDDFFIDSASRIKKDKNGNAVNWWLRDYGIYNSNNDGMYKQVSESGNGTSSYETSSSGVVLGFSVCLPNSVQYIIKFNGYNGTLKRYWANYGSTPVPPSDTYREGYVFDKWSPDIASVTDDQTYTAQYKRICNIKFNDYDGTQLLAYTIIEGNKPDRFPATPTREGYVFSAWSPSTDTTVYYDRTYTATYKKLYTIRFEDYDGTVLKSYQVPEGDLPTAPATPNREGYAFDHWSPSIMSAHEVMTYIAEYRKLYRVVFNDYNGTTLKQYWAEYNSNPSTPSDPTRSGYKFVGWSPTLTKVIDDVIYTATYNRIPTILSDTWETVNSRIVDGSYTNYYVIGDKISLNLGNEYNDYAEIVGINTDTDADGSIIPLTFITSDGLKTKKKVNSSDTTLNGYPASNLKSYVDGLKSKLPSALQSMIVPAVKTSRDYNDGAPKDLSTIMELWIPSHREIFGGTAYEQSGPSYSALFPNDDSRVKKAYNDIAWSWWLRSAYDDDQFRSVNSFGVTSHQLVSVVEAVVLGFCVGGTASSYSVKFMDHDGTVLKESTVNKGDAPIPPEDPTRTGYIFNGWDSDVTAVISGKTYTATYVIDQNYAWEQVKARINDGTYAEHYSIGDNIYLDIGDDYKGYVAVAGIDIDTDANGNFIPMTFISVDSLSTRHQMNTSNVVTGGYPASALKTYVDGLKSKLPSVLQSMIVSAVKTSSNFDNGPRYDLSKAMELWIPSHREVYGGTSYEKKGPIYDSLFTNNSLSRIKNLNGGSALHWWLRSAYSSTSFRAVTSSGASDYITASSSYGVAFGFCVDKTMVTIKFVDNDGRILKETIVDKGIVPTPPEDPTKVGYIFNGWDSEIVVATSNVTYTATYVIDPNYSWEQVKAHINDDSYKTYYSIGDNIYLKIGNEYDGYATVAGIDIDVDANGNTIPMTFITEHALATLKPFNDTDTTSGGYPASKLKTYVDGLELSMPSTLQSMIIPAVKTSRDYNNNSPRDLSTSMRLWLLSALEAIGSVSGYEQSGVSYREHLPDSTSKIKNVNGEPCIWWLRSATGPKHFRYIRENGTNYFGVASENHAVVIGFCVGKTST